MSFRNRLALFLLLTLVAVQGVTAFVVHDVTRRLLIDQGKQELRVATGVFQRELDALSGRVTDAVEVLALDYPFRQTVAQHDRDTALSVLRNHGRRVGAARMLLIELDGTVGVDTLATSKPRARKAAFPFPGLVKEAVSGERAAALAAFDGQVCWMVVVPVRAPVPIAFVAACIPIDNAFLDDLRTLAVVPMSIALATPGAQGGWSLAVQTSGRPKDLTLPLGDMPMSDQITSVFADGQDYLTLATRLKTAAESAPVTAVFDYPIHEALRPYRALAGPMALILGVALAVALAGAMLIAHGVSRPLAALAVTAQRIAAGDYTPPPKVSSRNEVGQLTSALGAMISAVSHRENALTEAMGAVETARDEALRANAAKSQFLANMSHELRTPLNAVIGFGEVIETEIMGPLGVASYRDYAKHIVDSGRHLLALVDEMLDLTKFEAGKLDLEYEEVELRGLVALVVRALTPLTEGPSIKVAIEGDAAAWPVIKADSRKLKQVFTALVGNAVKFTAKGGSVTLACDGGQNTVTIRITDTGIGIRAEDLKLVVKPFYRVNSAYNAKYQGVGLGLPLAKAIVELHGGRLSLESTPGVGTTVSVTLPRRLTANSHKIEAA